MNKHSMMTQYNAAKGISLSLVGYLAMALMSICAKNLTHLPIALIVFSQFFTGLIFNVPAVWRTGISGLKTAHPLLMMVRALTGLLSLCAMFFAMRFIPLVDAVVLQNTLPLFVPLLAFLCLRKKIPHSLWLGIITGFVGILLIIKPSAAIFNPVALIGLAAGLLSAASMICVSILKKTEPTGRITFYFLLIGTLATIPFMLTHLAPLNMTDIIMLLGIGFFTYIGQSLVTHAFLYGHPHVLAPLSYANVVFTGLLGWIIWNHVPDMFSFTGIILVSCGGIMTILFEKIRGQQQNFHQSVVVKLN